MAKMIALSIDMNDLYVVLNSGKTKKFSLSGNGVDISLTPAGVLKVEGSTNPNPGPNGVIRSKVNSQWTLIYNEPTQELDYIGVTDVLVQKTVESNSFDLGVGLVNIRLVGNSLMVTSY